MSDWQVGDLALCVDDAPQSGDWVQKTGLVEGRAYTVSSLVNGNSFDRCPVGLTLVELSPRPSRAGWCADRFRKIRPDEHEACEPEFVTLLKRSKRKVSEPLSELKPSKGEWL